MELDNVRSVEVFRDGSYSRTGPTFVVDPTVAVTIDDATADAPSEENNVTVVSVSTPLSGITADTLVARDVASFRYQ